MKNINFILTILYGYGFYEVEADEEEFPSHNFPFLVVLPLHLNNGLESSSAAANYFLSSAPTTMNPTNNSMFDSDYGSSSEPAQKRKRMEGTDDEISNEHINTIEGLDPPVRDPEYYLQGDGADCVILVENTLFKVH